jgi:D-alanyl-D-alanine carboxypeptidase
MVRLSFRLACLGVALAACTRGHEGNRRAPARTAATVPAPPPVSAAWLDSVSRQALTDGRLVGLSVGVAQDGKIVFAQGYGVASLAARTPVTPQTAFAVGSVTKQFTCSAALLLEEDGRLSMRDPVAKYFPSLTRAADITLLDLGHHVSGYRDYYPLDFVDREMERPTTVDAVIKEYATRPLDFAPETRWSYSNTNFAILGRVVEIASGMPFASFLGQRILTPLGLDHTHYDPARTSPGMATGYTSFALGAPEVVAPEGAGWDGMAGALWSTPTDLVTWDMALVSGKVLSPASYRTLTSPARLLDGRSTGYGCGEGVNERGTATVLSHGGAVSGFSALNIVVPATHSAVALLTNADFGSLDGLGRTITAKLVPQTAVPTINGPAALAAATAILDSLTHGKVDRANLGADFNAYLTAQRLERARANLAGNVANVRITGISERGGMEVADVRFESAGRTAAALMYRTPDGKVQEFLIYRP